MNPLLAIILCAANFVIGVLCWCTISWLYRKLPPKIRKVLGFMMWDFLWPRFEREMTELEWKLPRRALYVWLVANCVLLAIFLFLIRPGAEVESSCNRADRHGKGRH